MHRLLTLLLIVVFFFLYSYKLPEVFSFTSDFGRDMYQTIKIAQGDLVLIGPKMNLGGYWAGPHLYYLLAPSLLITNFEVWGVLYFHTFLFATSLGFFFFFASKKFGVVRSLPASVSIGLTPLFIISARYPSNGYTYLSLLLILFTFIFFLKIFNKNSLLISGALTGIIINVHPISLFPIIFSSFYIFSLLKNKKLFLYFLGSVILMFLPSLIFELTHDFVMTKDTFINKSYLSFTQTPNTPQFALNENRFVSSFMFISSKFKTLINFPTISIFTISFIALKFKKSTFFKENSFLFFSMFLSLILLLSVLRFHFEDHYIFSVAFLIFFGAIIILIGSNLWFITFGIILLQSFSFPTYVYQTQTTRSYKASEKAVKYSIENNLVSKNVSFNLIHLTDAYGLVPTGFEYRFFFRKHGFYPSSEYDYKTPKTLLIFSETPYYDIDKFKMWATEEFGREYFEDRQKYSVGNIDIYTIPKE